MMPKSMKDELALMAKRFSTTRNLGQEQSRIYRFNRKLMEFLDTQVTRFRVLSTADFPGTFRTYEADALRLHNDLQRAMANATTGSGEANERQLNDWVSAHWPLIESLKRHWQ
jgi:hypothetical protein